MRIASLGMALWFAAAGAWANETKLPKIDLPTDQAARQRGAETVVTVCLGCHNLKYIKYSDLVGVGFGKEKLDSLRVGHALDEPLLSSMSAEGAKQAFGTVPPDLSLMAKARAGGHDYVFAFLTGFYRNDKGLNDNNLLPGTKMPDILGVTFTAGEGRTAAENKAKDVVSFLEWASDPSAEERRGIGRYVMAYLVLLTILLYLMKRRTWAKVKARHHAKKHG